MLPEQKKKPRKHRVFKALMAEAVGFEPTCPCGQLHFECSSLQPLRYASMYKYSLFGANHMISSQPRYDHFDTSPYCGGVRRCVTPEKREQETTPATPTAILTRKRAFCKPFFDFYFLFNCFFAANGCPECEKMLNRDSSFPPAGKEGMPRSHAAFGRRPRRAGRQGS